MFLQKNLSFGLSWRLFYLKVSRWVYSPKSLEKPSGDPRIEALKFCYRVGGKKNLVWSLPTGFKGRLSPVWSLCNPTSRFHIMKGLVVTTDGSCRAPFTW
jgi:hypothetical protein